MMMTAGNPLPLSAGGAGLCNSSRTNAVPWRSIPAQAETGVMPWAADRVTDHETFGKWSAVVGAGCADRQHVVPAPDEQRGRIVDMAKEHGTVGKIGNRNTLPEIRAADRLSMLTHAVLPMIGEGERWPSLRSLPGPVPLRSCAQTDHPNKVGNPSHSRGATAAFFRHRETSAISHFAPHNNQRGASHFTTARGSWLNAAQALLSAGTKEKQNAHRRPGGTLHRPFHRRRHPPRGDRTPRVSWSRLRLGAVDQAR